MSVNFIKTNDGTITFFVNDRPFSVSPDRPCYNRVLKGLHDRLSGEELLDLLDSRKIVKKASSGLAEYVDGVVYYNGEPVHDEISRRICQFINEGLDAKHLLSFLERVEKNPSFHSREQLFQFLENKGLPITEDGYFLAYKAIRQDWYDIYSGTVYNGIGAKPTMDRNKVDDNPDRHCSKGLHVGAMDYVSSYGGENSRYIVVKVDPADVVSVPKDYSCMKCRTTSYEVLREYEGDLTAGLYKEDGATPVEGEYVDYEPDWNFADDNHDDYEDHYYDDSFEDGDVYDDNDC